MTVMRSQFISRYSSRDRGGMTIRRVGDKAKCKSHTLPTAASPSRTSLTLLLGLGGTAAESAMIIC